MKTLSVEEIQQVSLAVLERVDSFCKKHGIRYWISDGTLIGAIRHKGFIPWDDDLDITMPRPDYERFVREFEDDDEYRLFAPQRRNCYLTYARVCEMKRTCLKQENIWTDGETGVGIDVIPLNGAPSTAVEFMTVFNETQHILDMLVYCRHALSPIDISSCRSGFACLKTAVRWSLRVFGSRLIRRKIFSLIDKQERLRKSYDFDSSSMCHAMVIYEKRPHFWPKKWFAEVADVDFCGRKFPAPREYDNYLREYYGDYMTPPPEAERETHASRQLAFWR